MIHLRREPIQFPTIIEHQIRRTMEDLHNFFSVDKERRIQRNPPFKASLQGALKTIVGRQFQGKCAYCETKLSGGVVDQFRPRQATVDFHGERAPDHYWWLAYEWENLYYSCQKCDFSKGNKFPVRGRRGKLFATIERLRESEDCLLLDPCFDLPSEHISFRQDGFVYPLTEKGDISIDILNLNRDDLISARGQEVARFLRTADLLLRSKNLTKEWISGELRLHDPYLAAKIHALREEKILDDAAQRQVLGLLEGVDWNAYRETFPRRRSDSSSPKAKSSSISGRKRSLYSKNIFVKSIRLHNFRKITSLFIELAEPSGGSKPWITLIGENGVGKSSILKAVALALMDDQLRESLKLDARRFVTSGFDSGFVEIGVEGYAEPFRIDFSKGSRSFSSKNPTLNTLLFCYGGTRLLPRSNSRKSAVQNSYSRVGNLFDPFCPMTNASKWLLSLDDTKFEYGARAIRGVLTDDHQNTIKRHPETKPSSVLLEAGNTVNRLEVLSDGFQSVIALVSDILSIALLHFNDFENAEGIVVLDEVDVHLHPSWKIQIVGLLRKVFPRMQFILSTHDPLCLLDSEKGEVNLLLEHAEFGVIANHQLDVPPGMTADQILTGYWFGLNSTLDSETQELLEEHRQLLRSNDTKTSSRRKSRLVHVESTLRRRLGAYADTSIERLALDAVAEIVTEDIRDLNVEDRSAIRRKVKARLTEFLRTKETFQDADI